MKRYLVFTGLNYYPSGGMDDFRGDFDSEEKAIQELKICQTSKGVDLDDFWGHVWDSEKREFVHRID